MTRVPHKARRRPEAERAARRQAAVRVVEAQVAAVQAEAPARRQLYPMRHAEMVLPWTRGAPATDLVPELSDHYWEGELSAHPFWQESWVDVQPILQVAFASALKMSPMAGADPGALRLGGGPGTLGMKHLV